MSDARLQTLLKKLCAEIERREGHSMCVSVLAFNPVPGVPIQHYSNCKQKDTHDAMLSLTTVWETSDENGDKDS